MSWSTKMLKVMNEAVITHGGAPILLNILQSEINHELSSPRFKGDPIGPPRDFTLEWDAPYSKDIFLRKKCENGEEVAISALLGSDSTLSDTYPWDVDMKVCIRKPGLASVLQFDCKVYMNSESFFKCYITCARYLRPSSSAGRSLYVGPLYSNLSPDLQSTLDEYLKGMLGGSFTKFLVDHMHRKEQDQYVNWLQRLKERLSEGESSNTSSA